MYACLAIMFLSQLFRKLFPKKIIRVLGTNHAEDEPLDLLHEGLKDSAEPLDFLLKALEDNDAPVLHETLEDSVDPLDFLLEALEDNDEPELVGALD